MGYCEYGIELCVCKIRDFLHLSFWRRKFMMRVPCAFVIAFIAVMHQRTLLHVTSNVVELSRFTVFNRMKTVTDGGIILE